MGKKILGYLEDKMDGYNDDVKLLVQDIIAAYGNEQLFYSLIGELNDKVKSYNDFNFVQFLLKGEDNNIRDIIIENLSFSRSW